MRSLAGSAFLLGVLLSAPLVVEAPRGPASVLAGEPTSGQSDPQAVRPACTQGSRIAQSTAGKSAEVGPAESTLPAAPADSVCQALAAAAVDNDLPIDFFARLIWQESRFDPKAVSRAGAQGVAQFMPATASWRGLADPFDPVEAIAESARLLRDLRREFGNLGLAAAAYNAGPGRVRDWLAHRRHLPGETRAYVRLVTGRSAEEWTGGQADHAVIPAASGVPCRQIAGLFVRPSSRDAAPGAKPADPWGVELTGSSSEATALAAYRQLQQKYGAILAGREPRVVLRGPLRGTMGWARVRVGADSRANAVKLCANLRAAGASCEVQRN